MCFPLLKENLNMLSLRFMDGLNLNETFSLKINKWISNLEPAALLFISSCECLTRNQLVP